MNPMDLYYKNLADTTIKNLEKRQIQGFYCTSSQEAVTLASDMVTSGSTAAFGGSMTLSESGMMEALRSRKDLTLLDRDAAKDQEEAAGISRQSLLADYYFMSSNAVTANGELVNIDGYGNRVSALIFGPKQVIILAGMNKVVPTLKDAITRAQNTAAPANSTRLGRKTPCAVTGLCSDCLSPECICAQTVITRRSQIPDRIKVILINESLGY